MQYASNLSPSFRLNRALSATEPSGLLITPRSDLHHILPTYEAYMNLEMARDVKESLAKVADSQLLENDPRYANIPMYPYELPDGTVVDVNIERFQISELLFDPAPMVGQVFTDLTALYENSPSSAPGSMESVPKIVGKKIFALLNWGYCFLAGFLSVLSFGRFPPPLFPSTRRRYRAQ